MRWQPPSERVQMILLAPILIPVMLAAIPALVVCAGPVWIVDRISQWRRAQWSVTPKRQWFAWRPVKFSGFWEDVPDQWLWLERVDAIWKHNEWAYRPLGFVSKYDGDLFHD